MNVLGFNRMGVAAWLMGLGFFTSLSAQTFTPTTPAVFPVIDGTVAWGDYDGDRDLDLLVTGLQGNTPTSRVYRRRSTGAFTNLNPPCGGPTASP